MSVFTGNYREDLAVAKKLGIIKGNPKKEMLYDAIDNYNIEQMSGFQKDREMALLDELINACNDSTESDRPVSRLPKPVLKRDRPSLPKPVLKRDRIVVNPLKRPTPKPTLKRDRVAGPKPKLSKPNRSLFQ